MPHGSGTCRAVERAGVDAVHHHHPRIAGQAVVELAAADVHRVDAHRAPREQGLREAARGRADVDRDAAGGVDAEGIERALELQRAAADVGGPGQHLDRGVRPHGGPRLARDGAVHPHAARP